MKLRHDPKNPRKISKTQKRALMQALEEFGDLGGIVYNVQLDKLVSGHQRSDVLEGDITYTERLDPPDRTGTVAWGFITIGGTRFTYREVSWNERKHRAAMLAANKHGGEWDEGLLLEHLEGMELTDLVLSGFTVDERDDTKNRASVSMSNKAKGVNERLAGALTALERLKEAAEEAKNAALVRKVASCLKSISPEG